MTRRHNNGLEQSELTNPDVQDKPIIIPGFVFGQEDVAHAFISEHLIRISDIPDVVLQLAAKGLNASWAVLAFKSPHAMSEQDSYINLQFSFDGCTLGLDWVLLGQCNIQDKARLIEFISHNGFTVSEREMNDVPFLRVNRGELARLGTRIAMEIYGLACDSEVMLMTDGFEYRPSKRRGTYLPVTLADSTASIDVSALVNNIAGGSGNEDEFLVRGLQIETARLGGRRYLVMVYQREFDIDGLTEDVKLIESFDQLDDAVAYADILYNSQLPKEALNK